MVGTATSPQLWLGDADFRRADLEGDFARRRLDLGGDARAARVAEEWERGAGAGSGAWGCKSVGWLALGGLGKEGG
ncbi:UNVERIFIED_CONTAM: hypothetical protein Sradi_2149600 [Sesamum radiatum]|uniref:Uncharacterized protein n=1 Tax=Sesamum radiatum TaxID=300843 RepID=A0AAW2T006_SESRA